MGIVVAVIAAVLPLFSEIGNMKDSDRVVVGVEGGGGGIVPGETSAVLSSTSGAAVVTASADPAEARSSVSVPVNSEINVPSVANLTVGGRVVGGRRIGGKSYATAASEYLGLTIRNLGSLTADSPNTNSDSVVLANVSDAGGNTLTFRDRRFRNVGTKLKYVDDDLSVRSVSRATNVIVDVYLKLDEVGEWRHVSTVTAWNPVVSSGLIPIDSGERIIIAVFNVYEDDLLDETEFSPYYKPDGTTRYTFSEYLSQHPTVYRLLMLETYVENDKCFGTSTMPDMVSRVELGQTRYRDEYVMRHDPHSCSTKWIIRTAEMCPIEYLRLGYLSVAPAD